MVQLLTVKELQTLIRAGDTGVLFCFGTSLISKIIQMKTRKNKREVVPSHVALIYNGKYIYESTSNNAQIKNKTIPAGVRRYKITDFYELEKGKGTKYYFYPYNAFDRYTMEDYVYYPYGIDAIVDFVFKDKSDGSKDGLICSQYANLVAGLMDEKCPSPAQLYRNILTLEETDNNEIL